MTIDISLPDGITIDITIQVPSGSSVSVSGPGSSTSTTQGTSSTSTTSTTQPLPSLTGAYQLYCPNAPVLGDVVLNGVTTTASLSPANPNSDTSFQVTNYQSTVTLPAALATEASAVSTSLTGSAQGQLDLSDATPTTMSTGTLDFSADLSNIPSTGVPMYVPSTPGTLGPFTAGSGGDIVVEEDSSLSLTLVVAGTPLSLTCTAFPNNTPDFDTSNGYAGTGEPPMSEAIDPIIAVGDPSPAPASAVNSGGTGGSSGGSGGSSAGSGGASDPNIVSASSGSLAFTGSGALTGWIGLSGAVLVVIGFGLLFLIDAPRRLLVQLATVTGSRFGRSRRSRDQGPTSGSMHKRSKGEGAGFSDGISRLGSWFLGR